MTTLQPGRFNGASISTSGGQLHVRISDGGNWQLKARSEDQTDWRLLCTGNLEGGIVAPPPEDDRGPVSIGPLTVDTITRSVAVRGNPLTMAAREFDLLARLASDPERVFPKRQLLREIWGYPDGCRTRSLDSHASRVRVKLRRAGAPGFVLACHGVGYKLCADRQLAGAPA